MSHVAPRLAAVRRRLQDEGLDALYVQSAVNRRYLTGFTGSAGLVVIGRERAFLLVDFRYVEQAKVQAPSFEHVKLQDDPEDLIRLLREQGFKRVGFEAEHLSVHDYQELTAHAPEIEWVPTVKWVEAVRGIKDAAELAAIQRAVDLADAAFTYILSFLRPGRTEKEIAFELETYMRRSGAQGIAFPTIVASGPNGALPHAVPTDRKLAVGDLVTLDFGCVVDGYASDMTRTVAIGRADARARELYDLVLRAQRAGVAAVRPGRLGKEVDAVARGIIAEAGYGEYFGHGLGHGIGLEVHEEFPRLNKKGEVELAPGMVCSVEPGVYIPGWGGIRIEDLVVVDPDGCRVLTRSPKDLIVV